MDDEQSFAALLRSTTPASRPTWDAPNSTNPGPGASMAVGTGVGGGMSADPWANPFAASPPQPFAAPSVPRIPAVPDLPSPSFRSMSSPYDSFNSGPSNVGYTSSGRAGGGGFGNEAGMDDVAAGFGSMDIVSAPTLNPTAFTGPSGRVELEEQKESPYVQQLESEGIAPSTPASGPAEATGEYGGYDASASTGYTPQVDPPSVIAAREQEAREALTSQQAFAHDDEPSVPLPATKFYPVQAEATMEDDPFAQPFASPSRPFVDSRLDDIPPFTVPTDSPVRSPATATQTSPSTVAAPAPSSKKLPAGLIDDDLLAASDPMLSLKKAFVKSTPASSSASADSSTTKKEGEKGRASPVPATKGRMADKAKKTYVFNASPKKAAVVKKPQPVKEVKEVKADVAVDEAKGGKEDAATQADKADGSVISGNGDKGQANGGDKEAAGEVGPKQAPGDKAVEAESKTEAFAGPMIEADPTAAIDTTAPGTTPQTADPQAEDDSSKSDPTAETAGTAAIATTTTDANTRGTDETAAIAPASEDDADRVATSDPAEEQPSKAAVQHVEDAPRAITSGSAASTSAEPHTDTTPDSATPNALEQVDQESDAAAARHLLKPDSIPLPASALTSPGLSRQVSPIPNLSPAPTSDEAPQTSPSKLTVTSTPNDSTDGLDERAQAVQTPYDRVAVSPLDAPARQGSGFGFGQSSAIMRDEQAEVIAREAGDGWGDGPLSGQGQGRFTKGWGAVDDLFGRKDDPWGGDDDAIGQMQGQEEAQQGWQDEAGPSSASSYTPPAAAEEQSAYQQDVATTPTPTSVRQSPVRPKRKTHPVFTISVGDPTRVGDPVRGYTVYTIRTHTTSPHYRKSDLSALRRFSDFLWLVEALTSNNPGIIIPPVPDKHTFGRFQEQFIETRRLALERSLTKITAHPVLQLDPDLRLFLESDNFAVESKSRRPAIDTAPEQRGILSGWTGPRFVESDDWFVSRLAFLDSLEAQLRGLSKSVEISSKARLDYAIALGESAESMARLAESDLGSAMCAALARLADLGRTEKEAAEELAKGDVVNLLNVADEYIRFIGSVRIAMQARTRGWFAWQSHVKEANRFKATREKMRAQGKLGDRAAQSLAEANELDRRAADAERDYETTSKVIKSEFTRFERERVEEFKRGLERWLDVQITRQKEVIEAWEEYHGVVLRMVQKAQGGRERRE